MQLKVAKPIHIQKIRMQQSISKVKQSKMQQS
jgi:hypothetical protein